MTYLWKKAATPGHCKKQPLADVYFNSLSFSTLKYPEHLIVRALKDFRNRGIARKI